MSYVAFLPFCLFVSHAVVYAWEAFTGMLSESAR